MDRTDDINNPKPCNHDTDINIEISPDKMKAYISFNRPETSPENEKQFTTREIIELLNKKGVVFGINESYIELLAQYPVYNEPVCIAEGKYQLDGQDGIIQFHFDVERKGKPSIMEDGTINFKELDLIQNVNKDQVLCTLIPPVPGKPGMNVLGKEIPPKEGMPAKFPLGKNVYISEDGLYLKASIDGQVIFSGDKVNVYACHEINGDVDNSTGNISFIGNVIIKGNVLSGFTVEAGGNVEVWGVVEGAVIKAAGDIILRRGMMGMNKGILSSGGDIYAKFIESSTVYAEKNIKAEAIMHSNVKCGNTLELSGKKGLLVGGTCKVGKEIAVKTIGSQLSTMTEIDVGIDPTLRERHKSLKEEAEILKRDITKANQAVALLKKMRMSGTLTPDKQILLGKSIRTLEHYTDRLKTIQEEIKEIENRIKQQAGGRIRCYNCIYPATKITIGSCMMVVREVLHYCNVFNDGENIRVTPLT